MRLNKVTLFIVILIFGVGGIGLSMALDAWDKAPGKDDLPPFTGSPESSQSGSTVAVTPSQSTFTPAEIKGTNTFAEISRMFYIPIYDLGEAFGITSIPNYSTLMARELKAVYINLPQNVKLETESVRAFVSMYANKPYAYSATTYLPVPAVAILKQKATLSKEQLAFLDGHTLDISKWQTGAVVSQSSVNKRVVTGETSFQTIIGWGVPVAEIERIIGEKLVVTNILIRDYAAQRGKDFLAIVGSLQQIVDSYK